MLTALRRCTLHLADNNVAFGLWSVVLPLHFPLTSEWLAFCKRTPSLKMVSNDLWQQLFEFAKDADKDLSNFDEDGQPRRGGARTDARATGPNTYSVRCSCRIRVSCVCRSQARGLSSSMSSWRISRIRVRRNRAHMRDRTCTLTHLHRVSETS
jgi:hypothetical protein